MLTEQKIEFIEFLLKCDVLKFGSFITKSGRTTPYFINAGNFNTGKKLKILSELYANEIYNTNYKFNALFGPAYKGIALTIGCCTALFEKFKINMPFFFDRKESKDHGEGGLFVGYMPSQNENIAIVEDVLTAGTEINKIVPKLKDQFKIKISHLFIAVDRCEKIKNYNILARNDLKTKFNIEVHSIISIFDIKNYIQNKPEFKAYHKSMDDYIENYCI